MGVSDLGGGRFDAEGLEEGLELLEGGDDHESGEGDVVDGVHCESWRVGGKCRRLGVLVDFLPDVRLPHSFYIGE